MVETDRFDLYKPLPSELVDVDAHLNANWDKIDLAVKSNELTATENGLQSQINDLKAAVFGGASRDTAPGCKISKTAAQGVSNEVEEHVNFGNVVWESEPNMSDLTHNNIQVPVGGNYLIVFQWTFENFDGEHRGYVYIEGNRRGSAKFPGHGASAGNAYAQGIFAGIFNLNANDDIGARVWHNAGSPKDVTSADVGTTLAAVRLGMKVI